SRASVVSRHCKSVVTATSLSPPPRLCLASDTRVLMRRRSARCITHPTASSLPPPRGSHCGPHRGKDASVELQRDLIAETLHRTQHSSLRCSSSAQYRVVSAQSAALLCALLRVSCVLHAPASLCVTLRPVASYRSLRDG